MKKCFRSLLSLMLAAVLLSSSCVAATQAADVTAAAAEDTATAQAMGDEPTEAALPDAEPQPTEEAPLSTEPSVIGETYPTEVPAPIAQLSFQNTENGTVISWTAVEGAAFYELYLRGEEDNTLLATTDALSFEHAPLTDGTTYFYNIRSLDAENRIISDFAASDHANTYLAPPVIISIAGTSEGVLLQWSARQTERYRVYRRTQSAEWTAVGETADASYEDKTAVSGTRYSYTVQCIGADGEPLSAYNDGASISFVRTPSITSIENTATGARVSWQRPEGAAKCRLYYKNGSSWVKLTETADTSFVHDKLTDGRSYTYTVRGVDKNGAFVTDYDRDGWQNVFIKPPVITSCTNTDKGIIISWNRCPGAQKYRVYYYGSRGWTAMTDTASTSYLDTDVQPGYHYTYTVRCVTGDGTRFMSYFNSGVRTQYVGVPTISSIENTATGARLSWKKPAGADKCRIYLRNGSGWTRLTETAGTSYVHDKLTGGRSYTYTIRCVDSKGNFVSDYSDTGWSNTFIKPPVISSLTNTDKGVMIRWNACAGAAKYRVYYYGSRGWTAMTDTTGTSYLDTDVSSGGHYTYTVRCISANGTRFTSYFNSGVKTRYIGTPRITSFENTETGTRITWSKPSGAQRFRVYYRSGSGWSRLTETTATSFVHDKLTNNKAYTYTVRCVDSKGDFVSDYSDTGWSNTFLQPPSITGVSRVNGANQVQWKAVSGAAKYRLYRKGYKGSWSRVADGVTGTSYDDKTAKSNTLYAYTVRCLDKKGSVVSDYYGSDTYYYNGKLAQGNISVNGTDLYFSGGRIRRGYQVINGKNYYYNASGVLQKNGVVGSATEGYCYADKNGVIDPGYCNGVTIGGTDWNVINGRASRISSDSDRTLFRALKLVYRVTDTDMTRAQKLRACFDYLQHADIVEKNPRIPDYTGMDWPIVYANDIFVNNVGNCLSFAAAFAYMAKGIGYGNVYCCHSGGHGWAEINGLIYDPEWGMHRFKYSYFGMTYDEPCDVNYKAGIAPGYAWMHIKL